MAGRCPRACIFSSVFLGLHLLLALLPALDARTVPVNAAANLYCARCHEHCYHASWLGTKMTETQILLCTCMQMRLSRYMTIWQFKRKESMRSQVIIPGCSGNCGSSCMWFLTGQLHGKLCTWCANAYKRVLDKPYILFLAGQLHGKLWLHAPCGPCK